MGRFATRSIEREDLGDGDWVEIIKGVTQGDLADLMDEGVEVDADTSRVTRILAGKMSTIRLRAAISAWGGPGFTNDGVPVPVSTDAIRKLDPLEAQRLLALVGKHNPNLAPTAAEKKSADDIGTTSSNQAEPA